MNASSADAPRVPRIGVDRVYDVLDEAVPEGEVRILVDRLWPRGVRKDRLAGVEWNKDVAPSDGLRRAFHHEGLSWERFKDRYRAELEESGAAQALLEDLQARGDVDVTFLVSATDVGHSNGTVLRTVVEGLARG